MALWVLSRAASRTFSLPCIACRRHFSSGALVYDVAILGDGPLGYALAHALKQSPLTSDLSVAFLQPKAAPRAIDCWSVPTLLTPRSIRFLKACQVWDRLPSSQSITHISIMGVGGDAPGPSGLLEFDPSVRGPGATHLGCSVSGRQLMTALEDQLPDDIHRIENCTLLATRDVSNGVQLTYTEGDSDESTAAVLRASLVVATSPVSLQTSFPSITTAVRSTFSCVVETADCDHSFAFYRCCADGSMLHYLPLSPTSALVTYSGGSVMLEELWHESHNAPEEFLSRISGDLEGDKRVPALVSVQDSWRLSGAGHGLFQAAQDRRAILHNAACPAGLPGSDPYNVGFYNVVAMCNSLHAGCEMGQDPGSAQVLEGFNCKAKWYALQALAPPTLATLSYGSQYNPLNALRSLIGVARPAKETLAAVISGDYVDNLKTTVEEH